MTKHSTCRKISENILIHLHTIQNGYPERQGTQATNFVRGIKHFQHNYCRLICEVAPRFLENLWTPATLCVVCVRTGTVHKTVTNDLRHARTARAPRDVGNFSRTCVAQVNVTDK